MSRHPSASIREGHAAPVDRPEIISNRTIFLDIALRHAPDHDAKQYGISTLDVFVIIGPLAAFRTR